jgi:hypothetical protein
VITLWVFKLDFLTILITIIIIRDRRCWSLNHTLNISFLHITLVRCRLSTAAPLASIITSPIACSTQLSSQLVEQHTVSDGEAASPVKEGAKHAQSFYLPSFPPG